MVSNNNSYLIIVIICLHAIVWFQQLLSYSHDFQINQFDPKTKHNRA